MKAEAKEEEGDGEIVGMHEESQTTRHWRESAPHEWPGERAKKARLLRSREGTHARSSTGTASGSGRCGTREGSLGCSYAVEWEETHRGR